MSAREEPSYMMFARANARDGMATTATVVRELVARIDRDAAALKAADAEPHRTHQDVAAVAAVGHIQEAMDSLFKGQSTPTEAVRQITKYLSAYEAQA
jgi:hypothetical protein